MPPFLWRFMQEHLKSLVQYISIVSLIYTGACIAQFGYELRQMRKSFIHDLDTARSQMAVEMRYMYFQGCKAGIAKNGTSSPNIFDPNSDQNFCNDKAEAQQDYIYVQVLQLGKPQKR